MYDLLPHHKSVPNDSTHGLRLALKVIHFQISKVRIVPNWSIYHIFTTQVFYNVAWSFPIHIYMYSITDFEHQASIFHTQGYMQYVGIRWRDGCAGRLLWISQRIIYPPGSRVCGHGSQYS